MQQVDLEAYEDAPTLVTTYNGMNTFISSICIQLQKWKDSCLLLAYFDSNLGYYSLYTSLHIKSELNYPS